jgi:hypothetical protein
LRSVTDFENLGIVPEKHTRALPGNTYSSARHDSNPRRWIPCQTGASRMTDNETLGIIHNRPVG